MGHSNALAFAIPANISDAFCHNWGFLLQHVLRVRPSPHSEFTICVTRRNIVTRWGKLRCSTSSCMLLIDVGRPTNIVYAADNNVAPLRVYDQVTFLVRGNIGSNAPLSSWSWAVDACLQNGTFFACQRCHDV